MCICGVLLYLKRIITRSNTLMAFNDEELVSIKDPVGLCNHPLMLNTLRIDRKVKDDLWNNKPASEIWCEVFTDEGKPVCDFSYRPAVGQVGHLRTEQTFKKRLLGQQMLLYMMREMQQAGATHIWEVVPEDSYYNGFRPPFYSILWDFKFSEGPVHKTVGGTGYIMEIPDNINTLRIVPNADV